MIKLVLGHAKVFGSMMTWRPNWYPNKSSILAARDHKSNSWRYWTRNCFINLLRPTLTTTSSRFPCFLPFSSKKPSVVSQIWDSSKIKRLIACAWLWLATIYEVCVSWRSQFLSEIQGVIAATTNGFQSELSLLWIAPIQRACILMIWPCCQ